MLRCFPKHCLTTIVSSEDLNMKWNVKGIKYLRGCHEYLIAQFDWKACK